MPSRILAAFFSLTALSAQTPVTQLVESSCLGCHNGTTRSVSNGVLQKFDPASLAGDTDTLSRIYRQLQAGTMPPAGLPRPNRAVYDAALASIERELTAQPAAAAPSPQIATRLASLLWNAAPDNALLQDAQANRLHDPKTLEGHVRRMLADDRAQAFIARFFFPWLQLDKLGTVNPDPKLFPDFDPTLREAFAKETELFLLSQLRDDRDPIDLWTADYSFLNEALAKHYGVTGVTGAQFRRVTWKTPERHGLLGQASILMLTSPRSSENAYTSPAARGRWVRTHFLGVHPPNPAPNAPPVKPELPVTPQTREIPADPCRTCHNNFFPLGWGLEHFDALGRSRTNDQSGPADATGFLVDGTKFDGVVELRQALLQRPDAFRTAITERLLAFAGGSPSVPINGNEQTLIAARRILRDMPKPTWSSLIAAIALAQ